MSGPPDEAPVLRIRKDAERDVRYHYDRDERLTRKQPLQGERRPGCLGRIFRTGGRSLLPAILVVIVMVLVVLIVFRDRATGHLAGYDVRLRASPYQDTLLASVTVSWNPRAAERAAEADEVTVRFSTSSAGAASAVIEALAGAETVVRGRLPFTGAERRVDAEVAIGDRTVRLEAAVGKP